MSYTLTEMITHHKKIVWNSCAVFVSLTFDSTEEVSHESVAISLADLLASIGGFMGLFTGVSLYTFVDVFDAAVQSIFEKMKSWSNGRKSQKVTPKGQNSPLNVVELEKGKY